MCEDVLEFVVGVEGEFGVLFDVLDHLVDSDSLFGFHVCFVPPGAFFFVGSVLFFVFAWAGTKKNGGAVGKIGVFGLDGFVFEKWGRYPGWGKALLNSSRWSESVS